LWAVRERGHDSKVIVEMRTYKVKPGLRPEFLKVFEAVSVPAHADSGMPIVGPFLSIEDPDVFFFMRGFPDLQSRDSSKRRFYEGPLWKDELEGLLMPMLDRYDVVLVDDPNGRICWE